MTAVILQMGIGFVLFLLFPAGPPRFYAPLLSKGGFSPAHLRSWTGLYEIQQSAFDTVDPLRIRSAFPSLHCSDRAADPVLQLALRRRALPKAPAALLLDLSAADHLFMVVDDLPAPSWVPDIAAGLLLGLTSSTLAPRLRKGWPRSRPAVAAR